LSHSFQSSKPLKTVIKILFECYLTTFNEKLIFCRRIYRLLEFCFHTDRVLFRTLSNNYVTYIYSRQKCSYSTSHSSEHVSNEGRRKLWRNLWMRSMWGGFWKVLENIWMTCCKIWPLKSSTGLGSGSSAGAAWFSAEWADRLPAKRVALTTAWNRPPWPTNHRQQLLVGSRDCDQ